MHLAHADVHDEYQLRCRLHSALADQSNLSHSPAQVRLSPPGRWLSGDASVRLFLNKKDLLEAQLSFTETSLCAFTF